MDTNLIVSIVVPVFTSVITYLGIRHQSKIELEKLLEQQRSQIENVKTEFESYAETYEKTKQTDITHELFLRLLTDTKSFDNLTRNYEKFIKFGESVENPKIKR